MKTGDSSNLNLLPNQAKFQAARMNLQRILRRYMSFAVFLWLAVVVLTIVLYFGSKLVLSSQNKKYNQVSADFQGKSEEVMINQLLKYRTKTLGQVLKDRYEYSAAFEKINSIFSEKVKISKLELNKDRDFMVKVTAMDKESVDFVEKKVFEANKGEIDGVKNMLINNASYTIGGIWSINMEVTLK
jgi:hypothetical protein